ncbi:MAG: YggS family pyridoxal phosphate-dependent enzyme [Flavobacteriales bacterium]|nr:MAG: YggS family pyridoxal phosphate-dependent enzyme [Flavobacteriales bacterium]
MNVAENLQKVRLSIPENIKLVAVSKTKSSEIILEAYNAGHRDFAENRVQELSEKYEQLPKDIRWHMIGHLQTNKVKHIAPFVHLIHGVDSMKLLKEINKRATQNNRIIDCLLQIHIAQEATKFGFSFKETEAIFQSEEFKELQNINIVGLMGMATNTNDENQIHTEFHSLADFFKILKTQNSNLQTISMGMSSDYPIAIEAGSDMVRIGSAIFGKRH